MTPKSPYFSQTLFVPLASILAIHSLVTYTSKICDRVCLFFDIIVTVFIAHNFLIPQVLPVSCSAGYPWCMAPSAARYQNQYVPLAFIIQFCRVLMLHLLHITMHCIGNICALILYYMVIFFLLDVMHQDLCNPNPFLLKTENYYLVVEQFITE